MPSYYVYIYTNVRKPDEWRFFDDFLSINSRVRFSDTEINLCGRWRIDRSELQDNKMSKKSQVRYITEEIDLAYRSGDYVAYDLLSRILDNWPNEKKFCIVNVD